MELLIISEFKLLLWMGEVYDDVLVEPLLMVLFMILPDEVIELEERGMNLFDPPF